MSEIVGDHSNTEEKIHKPNCKRNVSGELDVFEATRYFSDFNELSPAITTEYSRIQTILAEHRQNKVHPETEEKRPEPRVVVVVKSEKKEMARGGSGKKLTSFLNSLLRSAGLKKSKIKSTLEVETPRGERKRRNSCVLITHASDASPLCGVDALRLNSRRRSFDAKHVKDSKKSDNVKLCESLSLDQKVRRKSRNAGDNDVNGGCESDSSSESDLFELDLSNKIHN